MTRYRIIISSIWWGFGLVILLGFLWLAMNPANFGTYTESAIDWIIPHLIPTMTLTGAVAYAHASGPEEPPGQQQRFAFRLTCLISVVYLVVLSAVIAYAVLGIAGESERGAVDALNSWNKILGVLQGLTASAIGVFFVRGDGKGANRSRAPGSGKDGGAG
jgi:hypothetical protein